MSFAHQDPEFGDLLARAAARRDIAVELVEKDHWEEIGPMFWGERITLADACADIRGWVAERLGRSRGPGQGES